MSGVDRLVRILGAITAVLAIVGTLVLLGHPDRVPATPRRLAFRAVPALTVATTTVPPTTTTLSPTTTTVAPPAPTTSQPPALPTRWRVGQRSLTFTDTGRPTPPAGGNPGMPSRSLPTVLLYPVDGSAADPVAVDAPPATGGPFPLIAFAHGFNSSPQVYSSLLLAWASAGYVVAAPEFPRSLAGGPLDEGDLDHQPGDVSFVISRILAGALPAGLVDPARIGVAGHSDGGVTAVGVGYNTCCHDARVSADVVMAGDEHDFAGGAYFAKGSPPLLVLQGDHDPSNDPSYGEGLFRDAPSPKYLVMLRDAVHLEPFTTDIAHLAVVERATIGFFDRYLKDRPDGISRLEQSAAPALATALAG